MAAAETGVHSMGSRLLVVIVNYRTAGLAIDCLRSIAHEVDVIPGTQVVVVDNASGDSSAERIASAIHSEGWSEWASTLALATNRGFAAGNNAAIRPAMAASHPPDWFLLLNPDTLVRPSALQALLDRAGAQPRAGIVGSQLENPDGTLQGSAFRFHTILTEFDGALRLGFVSRLLRRRSLVMPPSEQACRAGWVSGASLLLRREMLEDVGLLDEGYFLYYEEVDLCLRSARAGWECWHEPRSRVVHLVGASTGADFTARRLPSYVFDSRRRYFTKNHGRLYAALADLAWIGAHLTWRLRMWMQRRPGLAAPGMLRDFVTHSALLRGRAR